jgi:hypothetical protein
MFRVSRALGGERGDDPKELRMARLSETSDPSGDPSDDGRGATTHEG